MKKNIIFMFIFIFLLLPNCIKAREICDYESKARLQRLASNISSSYTYTENKIENSKYNTVKFTVTLSNVHNNLTILDQQTGETYNSNGLTDIVIENVDPGKYLKFVIYGNIEGCYEEKIATTYVTLPAFNKYYTDNLCRNIPEYTLCNKWANINLTYDQFNKKVSEYLNSLIFKPQDVENDNKISTFEKVIGFLAKYSLMIFGSVVLICAGLIYYLVKKDEFDLSLK